MRRQSYDVLILRANWNLVLAFYLQIELLLFLRDFHSPCIVTYLSQFAFQYLAERNLLCNLAFLVHISFHFGDAFVEVAVAAIENQFVFTCQFFLRMGINLICDLAAFIIVMRLILYVNNSKACYFFVVMMYS